MTRDEHKKLINQMLSMVAPENQANASEILTQITEDYEQTLTDFETATENVKELTANNENLRAVNSKLFLKVGETIKNDETMNNDVEDEPIPPPSFDTLFNEKGELI